MSNFTVTCRMSNGRLICAKSQLHKLHFQVSGSELVKKVFFETRSVEVLFENELECIRNYVKYHSLLNDNSNHKLALQASVDYLYYLSTSKENEAPLCKYPRILELF